MQEKEVNVLKVGISSTRCSNESYEIKDFGFFNIGMELIYNHPYYYDLIIKFLCINQNHYCPYIDIL